MTKFMYTADEIAKYVNIEHCTYTPEEVCVDAFVFFCYLRAESHIRGPDLLEIYKMTISEIRLYAA